jgi:hypothetical protein
VAAGGAPPHPPPRGPPRRATHHSRPPAPLVIRVEGDAGRTRPRTPTLAGPARPRTPRPRAVPAREHPTPLVRPARHVRHSFHARGPTRPLSPSVMPIRVTSTGADAHPAALGLARRVRHSSFTQWPAVSARAVAHAPSEPLAPTSAPPLISVGFSGRGVPPPAHDHAFSATKTALSAHGDRARPDHRPTEAPHPSRWWVTSGLR